MDHKQLEGAYHEMKHRAREDAEKEHRQRMENEMRRAMMMPYPMMMDPRGGMMVINEMLGAAGGLSGATEEKTKEPVQQAPVNKLLLLL